MLKRALPFLLLACWCAPTWSAEKLPVSSKTDRSAQEAMRIIRLNCLSCHNDEKKKGGLRLTTRENALTGGEDGPVLVPRKVSESLLAKVILPESDPHMPPKKQLSEKEISALRRWIAAGAEWDAKVLTESSSPKPIQFSAIPESYQPVLALALSPDEKYLAVGRANHIYIHDLGQSDRPIVTQLEGHRDAVQSLAWTPDGKRLAAGGFGRILLWNIEEGQSTSEPALDITNQLTGRITALQFTPEGATLIASDGEPTKSGTIHFLSAVNGQCQATVEAHRDSIYALRISPDGKLLASAGADKLVKLWDMSTREEVGKLEGHLGHVLALAFNKDGSMLASGSADKVLNIWDIKTRKQEIRINKHPAPIMALDWTQEGKSLFSVCEDGSPRLFTDFKLHSGAESSEAARDQTFTAAGEMLYSLAALSNGKTIFAGSYDGLVYIWNRNGKLEGKLLAPERGSLSRSSPEPRTAFQGNAPPTIRATARGAGLRASPSSQVLAEGTKPLSFINDVLPVLSKAGCNAGSCHAKPDGQNGFKLSVFAFDPKSDYKHIVKADRGRRIFPACPEESLILKKPTLGVDHEGGQRFEVGSDFYQTILAWIQQGMPFSQTNDTTLLEIAVQPRERRYHKGAKQSLRVQARYSDGRVRDVTHLAEFVSNDKEIAKVDEHGLVKVGNLSGEGVIITRFMGLVDISRVTVPSDKTLPASLYASLPVNNPIDRLVYARLKSLGFAPSKGCTDAEFIRRASLDTIGTLPTPDEAREFLADTSSDKRTKLIDRLLERPAYADHWAVKWGDLIRPNPTRVGIKPVYLLDLWLRDSFRQNKPYDQFVRELLIAQGSTHQYGPAALFRDKREPPDASAFISQIFLGVRIECAKCHHHPNEKWAQNDYYQLAAFFGQVKRKGQGISPPISGEAEYIWSAPGGEVKQPVTGEVMKPKPPDGPSPILNEGADPRAALVDWMTGTNNPFFARAIVNRIWAQFMGRGIVDPVDDFRASNPPTNEPLLDWLARDFAGHGYDLKHLIRTIMQSRVYQLSSIANDHNLADTKNFSRAYRRRLPAEVMLDAVCDVTGAAETFQGLPPGSRALETWNHKLDSEFLDAFGRPNSSAECPCERDAKPSVVQALHLMNSNKLQSKIASADGRAKRLADGKLPENEIVTELYLAAYSRFPSAEELDIALKSFSAKDATRKSAIEDLMWALLNSAEFVFNH